MAKEQKKGKRFLPWLMVLSMMLSLAPVNAFAEESNDSTAESYCPDSESKTESSDESSDNSSEVSEGNDAAEESSEDETTAAPEETEAASEDETDVALDAAFSVEAKAEAPATEESISTGSAVSEKAVVFAEESAAPPTEDVTYYPVYVYACFANSGTLLNRGNNHPAAVVTSGVKQEILWNEDASRGWYYITFGEVEKGTTEKPVKGAFAKFTDNWDAMLDFKGVGSAAGNKFELSNVDTWGDLGFNTGATGFPGVRASWHLDGQIDVHAVTYAPNGEGVSNLPASSADNRVYYRGTYTVAAEEPEREGYTFKGWKQDGSETLLHAGDRITLTGDATLTAEWEKNASDSSETPRYSPVYVYARFINGETHLSGDTKVIKNGVKKTITWNEDSNKGVQSVYYITFGHVANGTDVAPTNGASATFKGNLDDMFAFHGTGSASANGFALSDVTKWGSLSYNTGATGFHSSVSWHLDGDIRVYTVAYANGLDEASEETVADMPEKDTNYYLGTYTVTTAVPTREGYTFDGWTLDDKQVGETIDLSKISNKTAAEVTLTAQWKENAKPEQPAKKRHHSHTEDTAPVNSEVEIKDDEALGLNQADHYAYIFGYGNGEVRPQNSITRAETMSLVNRVLNRNPETAEDLLPDMITFTDNADTNAWYYLAVQEATNSHYNTSKENSAYEKWTGLRKTLD